ncbi:hypothetical protein Tco_0068068, partial [Tanacetum coccineum]
PVEETVFMVIEEVESDDDLEEEENNQFDHHAFMFHPGPPTKIAEMVQSVGSWKPDKELPTRQGLTVLNANSQHAPFVQESMLVRQLTDALKIIDQLRIEKERLEELRIEKTKLEEQKDEEIRELKAQLQKKKEEEEEVQFSRIFILY